MADKTSQKIETLVNYEGYENLEDLLEDRGQDSIVPGICINPDCDYTIEVEPDCSSGYCEECDSQTVRSILILLGVI
jgi:hypothetical protein